MNGFDFSEFSQLIDKIEALGLDEEEVTEAVLEAGSEPARLAYERNVPRSTLDKEHAQDHIKVSKTRKSKRGSKYRLIDAETQKKDPKTGKPVPYLYYVEYGHSRAPAHPFIEKAYREAHAAASDPMAEALVQKIEEKLR